MSPMKRTRMFAPRLRIRKRVRVRPQSWRTARRKKWSGPLRREELDPEPLFKVGALRRPLGFPAAGWCPAGGHAHRPSDSGTAEIQHWFKRSSHQTRASQAGSASILVAGRGASKRIWRRCSLVRTPTLRSWPPVAGGGADRPSPAPLAVDRAILRGIDSAQLDFSPTSPCDGEIP